MAAPWIGSSCPRTCALARKKDATLVPLRRNATAQLRTAQTVEHPPQITGGPTARVPAFSPASESVSSSDFVSSCGSGALEGAEVGGLVGGAAAMVTDATVLGWQRWYSPNPQHGSTLRLAFAF
jgi:hypothetical protein